MAGRVLDRLADSRPDSESDAFRRCDRSRRHRFGGNVLPQAVGYWSAFSILRILCGDYVRRESEICPVSFPADQSGDRGALSDPRHCGDSRLAVPAMVDLRKDPCEILREEEAEPGATDNPDDAQRI